MVMNALSAEAPESCKVTEVGCGQGKLGWGLLTTHVNTLLRKLRKLSFNYPHTTVIYKKYGNLSIRPGIKGWVRCCRNCSMGRESPRAVVPPFWCPESSTYVYPSHQAHNSWHQRKTDVRSCCTNSLHQQRTQLVPQVEHERIIYCANTPSTLLFFFSPENRTKIVGLIVSSLITGNGRKTVSDTLRLVVLDYFNEQASHKPTRIATR